MRFPSFWEFKRRFFSRLLKVLNDIVKSEFMLEPGIITCGLPACNTVLEDQVATVISCANLKRSNNELCFLKYLSKR